jgi:O-antigen ligase
MWVGTIEKIKGRPIAGWGVEQFAAAGPEKTLGYKQPHNMVLQLLFSTGILGAIAALLIALPFLPRLNWDMSMPDRLAAWGLIAGTLTLGLYDAAFYYTYPVMIFLMAVAIILKPVEPIAASGKSD